MNKKIKPTCPRCGNHGTTIDDHFKKGFIGTPIGAWSESRERIYNMKDGLGDWWRKKNEQRSC